MFSKFPATSVNSYFYKMTLVGIGIVLETLKTNTKFLIN